MNFDLPQRQSRAALILIIFNRFKGLITRLWPFFLFALVKGEFSFQDPDEWTIGILAITTLTAIISLISYFRYFFWIEDDQFVIKKGIFNKSITQIPFDRIQTIDFEQNLLQQAFNVVGLKIETAGSSGTETKMEALDKEKAKALREFILSQKKETTQKELEMVGLVSIEEPAFEEIYKIDFPRLIKIGITENHFRSGFAIIIAGYWFLTNLDEAGFSVDELGGDDLYHKVIGSISLLAGLGLLFILVAITISIVRVFLRHYDLRFLRSLNGFKLVSGLFNRKEVAAIDQKVQLVEWKQNLIQKKLGYHQLVLKQASSVQVGTKKSIVVPGVNKSDIGRVKDFLFPDRAEDEVEMHQLNHWFIWRPILYLTIAFIVITCALIYVKSYIQIGLVLMFFAMFIVNRFKKYKKAFYGVNQKGIFVFGGVFGHSKWMTLHHKIQSLSLTQTPFFRRRGLANLQIHTASGTKVIPYLELDKAQYLYDYLCYKVELSEKEFM